MNAKVLEYLIRGNSNDFVAAVGNAKTTHQQAIENMTAAARRLELFGKAQADAKQTASEFFKLKNETAAYQTALAAARGPLAAFQEGMTQTQTAARQSASAVKQQKLELRELQAAQRAAAQEYAATRKEALAAGGSAEQYAGELARTRRQLDSTTAAVETMQRRVATSGAEYANQQAALERYRAGLANAQRPVQELEAQVRKSELAQQRAGAQMRNQVTSLNAMRDSLAAAGIDTRNLAGEQTALNGRIEAANKAQRLAAAERTLGLVQTRQTTMAIAELERAYRAMASSGRYSSQQLEQAAEQVKKKIVELQRQASQGVNLALNQSQPQPSTSGAGDMLRRATAGVGAAAIVHEATQQTLAYGTAIAKVGTQIDGNRPLMAQFDGEVRKLAKSMGVDATESANALADIFGSRDFDHPAEAMTVLNKATVAAKGGFTDVGTAVQVGLGVLNAYGKEVGDLEGVYDVLFQTVKDGVTNFPALAQGLGQVVPTAVAAGVSFEELGAALAVLTKNGVQTPQAITAINGAIVQLAAPTQEAKEKLKALGIQWTSLGDTIRQISEKNLSLDAVRSIVPDIEGARGVLTLASHYGALTDEIERMKGAAGAAQGAFNIVQESDAAKVAKFKAEINDLLLELGKLIAQGQPVLAFLTDLLRGFNDLPDGIKEVLLAMMGLATATAVIKTLGGAFLPLSGLMANFTAQAKSTAAAMEGVAATGNTAAATLPGAAKGMGQVAAAAKGLSMSLLGLAAYGVLISQLLQLYQLWRENQDISAAVEQRQAAAQQAIKDYAADANLKKLSADELEKLTDREREEYAKRLGNAQKFWQSKASLESEKKWDSADAFAAARQQREYAAAQEDLQRAKVVVAERKKLEGQLYTAKAELEAKEKERSKKFQEDSTRAYEAAISTKIKGLQKLTSEEERYVAHSNTLQQDQTNVAIDQAKKRLEQLKSTLQKQLDAEKKTADKIKELKADKESSNNDVAGRLRALKRRDMSEGDQQKDIGSEAEEKLNESRRARNGGNFAEAKRLAQAAMSLGEQIKDSKRAVELAEQAANQLNRSQDAEIEEQQKLQQKQQADAKATEQQAVDAQKQIDTLTQKLSELVGKETKLKVDTDIEAGKTKIAEIQAKLDALKDKTVTVTVAQAGTAALPAAAAGDIQKNAEGGHIRGPGTGTSDSILSWLSDGEYVLRSAAVSHYGVDLLHALNQMRLPKFAQGGLAGRMPALPNLRPLTSLPNLPPLASLPAPRTAEAVSKNLGSLDLVAGGRRLTVQGDPDAMADFKREFLRLNLKNA
ncbi:phage tail tape measure protein [Chromobacterium haemolyticum]|uniref:phage tail tape measure protein n=1 Tax=Chromobacterium haemolyticum TaxID=394935 RepID=UPI0009D97DEA|nr:phage tail tape measure protein [Chromobacterium haemolyticum]OQS39064.1 phage tail tape measure protein [Chromobacterium haemolyticum]